jgi:hypothetical protein
MRSLCDFDSMGLLALAVVLVGCSSSPHSLPISEVHSSITNRVQAEWFQPYRPAEQASEPWSMFAKDILPGDFVRDYQEYASRRERPLVAWTGVVVERMELDAEGERLEQFVVEHRYWDWKTTTDDHLIFVSDLGEGYFQCAFSEQEMGPGHSEGQFVIAYGFPFVYDESTNVIIMECMNTRFLPPKFFTTRGWRYGRGYALHGDLWDIQILDPHVE